MGGGLLLLFDIKLGLRVVNFLRKLIDKVRNQSVWNRVLVTICCSNIEIIFST